MERERTYLMKKILPAFLPFFLAVVPLVTVLLERPAPLEIGNDTDKTLNIFMAFAGTEHVQSGYQRFYQCHINPGEYGSPGVYIIRGAYYLIEARGDDNNAVFSKEFSEEELSDMNWMVTIPKSQ